MNNILSVSWLTGCCWMILSLSLPSAFAATDHQGNSSDVRVNHPFLPPLQSWHGPSEALVQTEDNPWQTPAESTGLQSTPNYQQTMDYLKKLADSDSRLQLVTIGQSPQGRDIKMLIASQESLASAESVRVSAKPTLLVQAGIHSGEIDGKDAGLMLLRDIVHGQKADLLKGANLLFIPILSVDAHERSSAFNRVNQRGPSSMGWRTNSQNLNLNRDYAKLDTLELRSVVQVINQFQPELYLDVHVTDGEDYQYDITYGFSGDHADSPQISRWLSEVFSPGVNLALAQNGHKAGPLVFGLDGMDFAKGIVGWTASPRYSNGYGDLRHLPTVLVENHSLKPFKQRVLGTYVLIEQALKTLGGQGERLQKAIAHDQATRPSSQVLAWDMDEKPGSIEFAGVDYTVKTEAVTGLSYVEWTGEAKSYPQLPYYQARTPKVSVKVPKFFYLPAQYRDIAERLALHGIHFDTLSEAKQLAVIQLQAAPASFAEQPFEGRQIPTTHFTEHPVQLTLPKGTLQISTDQSLGRLAVALLDPRGPDSFFQWGFFNSIFQRTEYIESYALIPLIKAMLAKDPALAEQFRHKKQTDAAFSQDPAAQMSWFYQGSDFYDQAYLKYPVLMAY